MSWGYRDELTRDNWDDLAGMSWDELTGDELIENELTGDELTGDKWAVGWE